MENVHDIRVVLVEEGMALVDGIQVYKVEAVSQSKSSTVWI
jgi:hypothetical protein